MNALRLAAARSVRGLVCSGAVLRPAGVEVMQVRTKATKAVAKKPVKKVAAKKPAAKKAVKKVAAKKPVAKKAAKKNVAKKVKKTVKKVVAKKNTAAKKAKAVVKRMAAAKKGAAKKAKAAAAKKAVAGKKAKAVAAKKAKAAAKKAKVAKKSAAKKAAATKKSAAKKAKTAAKKAKAATTKAKKAAAKKAKAAKKDAIKASGPVSPFTLYVQKATKGSKGKVVMKTVAQKYKTLSAAQKSILVAEAKKNLAKRHSIRAMQKKPATKYAKFVKAHFPAAFAAARKQTKSHKAAFVMAAKAVSAKYRK